MVEKHSSVSPTKKKMHKAKSKILESSDTLKVENLINEERGKIESAEDS